MRVVVAVLWAAVSNRLGIFYFLDLVSEKILCLHSDLGFGFMAGEGRAGLDRQQAMSSVFHRRESWVWSCLLMPVVL